MVVPPRVVFVRELESKGSEVLIFFIKEKEMFYGSRLIIQYSFSFVYFYCPLLSLPNRDKRIGVDPIHFICLY